MADQQWFYQQQPAYGYDPYGQPADVPTSAAEYHYGSYYQQNGHPQQQSAALEPLYGQQIIDAALSYGQYGAAAAPGAYVGHNGFGAAYIAAPHDVQQHHHQLQQPHQMQHIQYSGGYQQQAQVSAAWATSAPASFQPAPQLRASRALRIEAPRSAGLSPANQVTPQIAPHPRPRVPPRPAVQQRQAGPPHPSAQQRLAGPPGPKMQPLFSHAVKIEAPKPAPKASVQPSASYAAVKVQQPTATAPRTAIPSGPRVAAPTTVTSGTASNGMPTLRQSSAASSLVAAAKKHPTVPAGSAKHKAEGVLAPRLPALRTAAPVVPARDRLQPTTPTSLRPVAPAFVPPSGKGAAAATQHQAPKNGMDGVTSGKNMSAAAPAIQPSHDPRPYMTADPKDLAKQTIQLGDWAGLADTVSTAASAVSPADAASSTSPQVPQDVPRISASSKPADVPAADVSAGLVASTAQQKQQQHEEPLPEISSSPHAASTAASAVVPAGAAAEGPPLQHSASLLSDASSKPAKLSPSDPAFAAFFPVPASSKSPVPAPAEGVDGPSSPVPSQSSKALLRGVSELSSVAESKADGPGEAAAAPAAADSPTPTAHSDNAPPAPMSADSTSASAAGADVSAWYLLPDGMSDQPAGKDVATGISTPDSRAASPPPADLDLDGHSRMLSFGDFSPRAVSPVTTVGFATDPQVAFLGPGAVRLPGSLTFGKPATDTTAQPPASSPAGTAKPQAASTAGSCHQDGPQSPPLGAAVNGTNMPSQEVGTLNGLHGSGTAPEAAATTIDAASENVLPPRQAPVHAPLPGQAPVPVMPSQTAAQTAVPIEQALDTTALATLVGSLVPAQPVTVAPVMNAEAEAPGGTAPVLPAGGSASAGAGSPAQSDSAHAAKSPGARQLIKAVRSPAASTDAGHGANVSPTAAPKDATSPPAAATESNGTDVGSTPHAEPVKRSVSPAVAFDEHEHSVFDEEEADPNDEDDEEEFNEEDGFDSNEANWARKEALRQGKVLATGGTHADLTMKQKRQATAARVAYKPAPRWSAGTASSGSEASDVGGRTVRDGGAPTPAPPAWTGNSKPASDPCKGGAARRSAGPPQKPRAKGPSRKEAAAAAAAAASEKAKERQRAQAASIRVSLAQMHSVKPAWLTAQAKGTGQRPPLPRNAGDRGPSPLNSPAAAPISPPTGSLQMPAWQLPAAASAGPRPPPPSLPSIGQLGSPATSPAQPKEGPPQSHMGQSPQLPMTPTVSSVLSGASLEQLAPPPPFPAQHTASLAGSQQGLFGASSLPHHTASSMRSSPMPSTNSTLHRRMGPSGSPPMPTWDVPKPPFAASPPAAATPTAVMVMQSPGPTPAANIVPGAEAAQQDEELEDLLAMLLAPGNT